MAEIAPFAAVLPSAKDFKLCENVDYQKQLGDGTLARDRLPAIYRYHQVFEHHHRTLTRKGLFARVRLSPYGDGSVVPHRRIRPATVAERAKQMEAARAHLTPPFALYSDRQRRIDDLFEPLEKRPAELEGQSGDGVIHRLWRLTDEKDQARLATILSPERLYLAHGHHQYAAMLALRDQLGKGAAEDSALQYGPMYFCNEDDEGLVVVATHRVLHGLGKFDRGQLLERAREFFTVAEGPLSGADAVRPALAGQAKRGPAFAIVTPGVQKIAYLRLRGDLIKASVPALAESRGLGDLDLTYLHALVLEEILALDAAAQERHLRYVRSWDQAFAELAAADVQALFLMNPTRLELMRAVADEGRVMPERATWFHPAIPSGLVIHPLDPAESVRLPSLY